MEYRIEPHGSVFIVIDPSGERLVPEYLTIEQAEQEIERCKKKDGMYRSAKLLVDAAIKAHMEINGVGRETARYWLNNAMETTD